MCCQPDQLEIVMPWSSNLTMTDSIYDCFTTFPIQIFNNHIDIKQTFAKWLCMQGRVFEETFLRNSSIVKPVTARRPNRAPPHHNTGTPTHACRLQIKVCDRPESPLARFGATNKPVTGATIAVNGGATAHGETKFGHPADRPTPGELLISSSSAGLQQCQVVIQPNVKHPHTSKVKSPCQGAACCGRPHTTTVPACH
jgi:hypothetical protein